MNYAAGAKRSRRQHLANYVLAPALQNSQRCGESENIAKQAAGICSKRKSVNFL